MQAGWLARDMQKVDQFVIYQTIGRDAGWLAAAAAVVKRKEDDPPHLIYCPERRFPEGRVPRRREGVYRKIRLGFDRRE